MFSRDPVGKAQAALGQVASCLPSLGTWCNLRLGGSASIPQRRGYSSRGHWSDSALQMSLKMLGAETRFPLDISIRLQARFAGAAVCCRQVGMLV